MRSKLSVCATLLVFAGVVPTGLLAQSYAVDRGSVLIDGQASFTSTGTGEEDEDRVTQLSINPALQYFILPGLALGGEITIARSWEDDYSAWTYGIGPAVTYYFGDGERPWYPYLGATAQFLRAGQEVDNVPEIPDVTVWAYKGAAGALFLISRSVGVNAELFYQVTRRESDSDFDFEQNVYGLAVGISAFVF